jgi:uncharacterized protein (TIGR00255 family)
MTLASMTGFSRAAVQVLGRAVAWEARSVNGRGLDIRLRLPPGFDRLESEVRARVAKNLDRGNVTLNLSVETPPSAPKLQINRAALDQVMALVREIQSEVDAAAPRLDGLLSLRGVIETVAEPDLDAAGQAKIDAAILSAFDTCLDGLVAARGAEGKALAAILTATLDEIEALAKEAAANAATRAPAIKARLEAQLGELLGGLSSVDPQRLAHEAALLAVKADVREELDRLGAHIAQARELLAKGKVAGRKLDFLSQEFNREANTLCSKSADIALTRTGLALKTAIDRLREQAANVE